MQRFCLRILIVAIVIASSGCAGVHEEPGQPTVPLTSIPPDRGLVYGRLLYHEIGVIPTAVVPRHSNRLFIKELLPNGYLGRGYSFNANKNEGFFCFLLPVGVYRIVMTSHGEPGPPPLDAVIRYKSQQVEFAAIGGQASYAGSILVAYDRHGRTPSSLRLLGGTVTTNVKIVNDLPWTTYHLLPEAYPNLEAKPAYEISATIKPAAFDNWVEKIIHEDDFP